MKVKALGQGGHLSCGLPELLLFASLACLGGYLLVFRMGYSPPSPIFWVTTLLAILVLIWSGLSRRQSTQVWGLVGALILTWSLKSLFVPSAVPFFGSDAYIELAATKEIEGTGWFNVPPWSPEAQITWPHQRNYPFLAGISIAITRTSGLSLEIWARWGVVSLSLVSILFVYGIARSAYGSGQTALLSAIGFGLTYYCLMFHSMFLRETIAFVLFLATLYATIRSERRGEILYRVIAMTTTVGVVLAHHLTALMLVLFLLLYNMVSWLSRNRRAAEVTFQQSRWTFVAYVLVVLLTYWIYLRYTPIRIAYTFVEDAFQESALTSPTSGLPRTFRYTLTLVLQSVSALALGLLAVYGLFTHKAPNRRWQIASVLWGGGLGLSAWLGLVGVLGQLGSFPGRMEVFGYAFLIPAAVHTISQVRKRNLVLGLILGAVLLMHGTASLLRIQPYLYGGQEPNLAAKEPRTALLRQEYDLLTRVRPSPRGLVGHSYRRLEKVNNLRTACLGDAEGLALASLSAGEFDYIMIGQADHYRDLPRFSEMLESPALSKVYDAGWAELYVPSPTSAWHINSVLDIPGDSTSDIVASSGKDATQTSVLKGWILSFALLLYISLVGWRLLQILGSQPDRAGKSDSVGEQATGICLGLLFLFVGFLIFDFTGGASVLLLLLPLLVVTAVLLGVWLRRVSQERPQLRAPQGAWASVGLLCIISVLAGAIFQAVAVGTRREPYTEFYALALNYRQQENMIVVANRGPTALEYRIEGWLSERKIVDVPNVVVPAGATWSSRLPVELPSPEGLSQPVALELHLSASSGATTDQTLRLWINRAESTLPTTRLAPPLAQ